MSIFDGPPGFAMLGLSPIVWVAALLYIESRPRWLMRGVQWIEHKLRRSA